MFAYNPVPKPQKSKRIRPTQKMLGSISSKVRKEVRLRSGGTCEVKERCYGAPAVQQAHITGRKQLTHKTTAADLLDSCLDCHKWLDETPEGIQYKRKLQDVSQLIGSVHDMGMSKEDYFFFEWLIISKGMSQEDFSKLSSTEIDALHSEWRVFYYGTK